jgi:IMP dehydrogenase/GMP reductase
MERLLELDDITLLPARTNNGSLGSKACFTVKDELDNSGITDTLPIFTSPMEAVVGENSCKIWQDYGIRPVMPRTESLELRLQYCPWIFSAFSISEIQRNFLNVDQRRLGPKLHICIDCGNGHDTNLLQLCFELKKLYGPQVIVMGGNVGNVETYSDYSKAGFDYIRVGISSGSLVDKEKYGFHYPMASLLMDMTKFKATGGVGLRPVKIIADGGIESPADVLKAMALGADYVMIGKDFARIIEAEGTLYQKNRNPNTGEYDTVEVSNQEQYYGTNGYQARANGFCRAYHGNTTIEIQSLRAGYKNPEEWKKHNPTIKVSDSAWTWIDVDCSIQEWVEEFQSCVSYGFTLAAAKNWEEFKKNIRFGRV